MDQNMLPPDEFRGRVIDLAGTGGDGSHPLLWVIVVLLLVLLAVTVASLLLDEHRRRQTHEAAVSVDASPTDLDEAATETSIEAAPGGDALAILDARYAAGEVVRRDYLRIRRDILGPNAAPS